MRISNSEIQTFKRCRRKWWFNYYLRLRPNVEESGVSKVGTRVHACLARYYESLLHGDSTDAAVQAALVLHDNMTDDETEDRDLSYIMLEGYFEWLQETGADEGLTPIAPERQVSVTTETGTTVLGKLDLRLRRESDGAELFIDHKTVQELSSPPKTLHLNEQAYMYEWLLTQLPDQERVDGGIFNYIRRVKRTSKATPPFYSRTEVRHTAKELEAFSRRLAGELRAIQSIRVALDERHLDALGLVYPTPTATCSWDCPYFAICPMTDRQDGSLSRMIELSMTQHDPYERYNDA